MPYTVVASLLRCAVLASPDGYASHTESTLHPVSWGMDGNVLARRNGNLVLSEATLSRRHVRSLSSGWSGSKKDPGPLKRAIGNNIRFKYLARPILIAGGYDRY